MIARIANQLRSCGGLSSRGSLDQLDLAGVIDIVRGDAADHLEVGPAAARYSSRQLSGVEMTDHVAKLTKRIETELRTAHAKAA
jgi:hypothetical protein